MNKIITVTIILALILVSGLARTSGVDTAQPVKTIAEPGTQIIKDVISSIPVPTPTPAETPHPMPTYAPSLRAFEINTEHDIWHARDPSSYITPENEWVRYFASQLYLDYDGRLKYINQKVPLLRDKGGQIVLWTNETFANNYVYDWEQFGTGARGGLANDDYWINPDYYLAHGMKGDCEDWSLAVTSLMLSGEMSVWQDKKLIKQVIPAKTVLGYVGNLRDVWTEYRVYGKTWITNTARRTNPETGDERFSSTIFIEKDTQFQPVFEFTNEYFGGYKRW